MSPVERLYAAFATGDMETVMAVLAPDVVISEPASLPYGGTYESAEAFLESVVGWMMGVAELTIGETEVVGEGARVAGRFSATLRSRASGEEFALEMVELYDIADGRITRIDVYPKDTQALAEFYARG